MDGEVTASDQDSWVQVDAQPSSTLVLAQPLLQNKTQEERVKLLIAAWALLLHRGSACCNDEETLAFGRNDGDQGSVTSTTRRLQISQLVQSKGARISSVLEAADSILGEAADLHVLGHVDDPLYLSNDRADVNSCFAIRACTDDATLHLSIAQTSPLLSSALASVFLHAYADIINLLLSNPESDVIDTFELGKHEFDQLWKWNKDVPLTIDRCVHDIIKKEAQENAERTAVVSWDGQLTYREVDDLSDLLAYHLIEVGVEVGDVVPLCFEKSMWTIVGVLGVLKAGAGVALTDPSQPEARLQTIAQEVGAKVVVTSVAQCGLGKRISPTGQVVAVGAKFRDEKGCLPPSSGMPDVPSNSTLYIIFTSGSTGKPKGVVISHSNYLSGAFPRAEMVGYKPHSRVLDFPSYAFDVSVDCMLCTLLNGGCICVPSEEERVNDMNGAIRRMSVNMAHMTPSVARVLDADIMPSLEILGLGGESVSSSDAAEWSKLTKIVIAYGPSECTVGCTCNNQVTGERPYTSIGKGVGGVMWIVDPDDHNKLAPLGAVGELLVEGPIVGKGYLNEPEKTAAVFINDPSWLTKMGRSGVLYKTGDLVKYDPDGSGSIVFVGRGDQQVKLRGQRVELGEIEHHLRNNVPGGVSVAVEVIKPNGKGEPVLVAFVSEQTGDTARTAGEITAFSTELSQALADAEVHLAGVLPRYMVPNIYIPLKEMPLLVSLKTDRKKLRALGSSMSRKELSGLRLASVEKTQPTTPTEITLCKLWHEILGDDVDIGANDNFFDVGGDSLRAMRLVAVARKEGLSLTVLDIFKNPKLSDMAQVAGDFDVNADRTIPSFSLLPQGWSSEEARTTCAEMVGVLPEQVEDVYPCTPLQEGLMALSAKVKDAYVAQRVVELESPEVAERLKAAFQEAAEASPILRTRIVQVRGRGLMQVVAKQSSDQWYSGEDLEQYLEEDRERSMGLGTPLCRFALINNVKTGKIFMVLTIHHALYDGWSMPLVVERVNRAYRGLRTERPASFKAFIKHLGSLDRSSSEAYWRNDLQGANGLQFPAVPYPEYQHQAQSLLEHYVSLPEDMQLNTSVATLIRGAWALVASHYIASNDVVFGETLTGRNAPVVGVEQIEGPMITTVPVRVQIDERASVAEYLSSLHDSTIQRIPHEHMGLQHIRKLSPEAREACELRTGLVIHPTAEDEEEMTTENSPANGFVPAGDAEAAQEALKFNSYGLMLVFTQDTKGFLVMASFDSRMVDMKTMAKALKQLETIVQRMCENTQQTIGELSLDYADGFKEQLHFNERSSGAISIPDEELAKTCSGAEAAWIVDPRDSSRFVSAGVVGELLLEGNFDDALPTMDGPEGLASYRHTQDLKLYRTSRRAKFTSDGELQVLTGVRNDVSTTQGKEVKNQAAGKATPEKVNLLRVMWSRVLGMDEAELSPADNFFELGGDSIGAMKLVSEARLEGYRLTVAQIFQNRLLGQMAGILEETEKREVAKEEAYQPFASLNGVSNAQSFVDEVIQPALADKAWYVKDVYLARPLQEVAIEGTFRLPRYSQRYELFYLDEAVDRQRLSKCCQELVSRNEILRTVFIPNEQENGYYGVVLEHATVPFEVLTIEGQLEPFVKQLCNLDVKTAMPLGSLFVKFFFVQAEEERSCLVLRISHAQYDEICLPLLLRQLSSMYEGKPVSDTIGFSSYVNHVIRKSVPESIGYWRELLQGSSLTVYRPGKPAVDKTMADVHKTVSIASRPRDITVATLPTAAWALCLSRLTCQRDVTFGEVVSGRNIDFPNGSNVMGPTWQYIPVRVKLQDGWTALDLLRHVQEQHINSTRFEAVGLKEVVKECTDWPQETDWFDSVVHQDVDHVEELDFLAATSRMETVYPHAEPLREWKIQAFPQGDKLTLEVVTFQSWLGPATNILKEMEKIMDAFMTRPEEPLF